MDFYRKYTLKEISILFDLKLYNVDSSSFISGISILNLATKCEISFFTDLRYKKLLIQSQACAILIDELFYNKFKEIPALVDANNNSKLILAKILGVCIKQNKKERKIHSSAVLGKNVNIDKEVYIGANCVIGDDVNIKTGTYIHSNVVIGSKCKIDSCCTIYPHVTLYDCVIVGSKTIIHSNTTIGSDGFGYVMDSNKNWKKIPHIGGVVLGKNVEIGSNTVIDRGLLDNTIISDQVIIDNHVQIGHNVKIGFNSAIAGCVGIAGSTRIGKYCLIGGGVGISDHLEIGDNVCINAGSGISKSLKKPGIYSSGFPAKNVHLWNKCVARFYKLNDLNKKFNELKINFKNLFERKNEYR